MNLAQRLLPNSYHQTLVYAALYITVVLNSLFLSRVTAAVTASSHWSLLFLLSVPVLVFCVSLLVLNWLALASFPRTAVVVAVISSSICFYMIAEYGVVIDKEMIRNVIETDTAEALTYVNFTSVLYVMGLGVLPALGLAWRRHRQSRLSQWRTFALHHVFAFAGIAVIAFSFYQNYAAVGRNHRHLTEALLPAAPYVSVAKFARDNYFTPKLAFKTLDPAPQLINDQRAVTVMVVGETARADNFSLGGYLRDTNSHTRAEKVQYFSQVSSCGTATAVSVPCMFSQLDREHYDHNQAIYQENALDVIQKAGVDVVWIDNNSSCKGVCERIQTLQIAPEASQPLCDGEYCYDEVLLAPLRQQLAQSEAKSLLIVLHMIGSHGPTYYRRYPAAQQRFTPDCPQSDIQNCTNEQLLNTYDNSIHYTDWVLAQIIEMLKEDDRALKNLLYVSDHGESLGENGVYLHGFPYGFAPEQQTHIPLIYWTNLFENRAYQACVKERASQPWSHDNVFDTLFGMVGVQSRAYSVQRDMLHGCAEIAG